MFENPYIVALYGWVVFNFIILGMAKDKDDEKKKRFNYRIWWRYHWDNVVITLLLLPAVVEFSEDIWVYVVNGLFNQDLAYSRLGLMGAVPLTQLIYYLIRKFQRNGS